MRARAWWLMAAVLVLGSVSGCESLLERREEREERLCRERYGNNCNNQCCQPVNNCGCQPSGYAGTNNFAPPPPCR